MRGYTLSRDWIFRPEKDGGYIYDPENDEFHVINERGRDILLAIEHTCLNIEQILSILNKLGQEIPNKDTIEKFIERLRAMGIVQVCNGTTSIDYNLTLSYLETSLDKVKKSRAPFIAPLSLEIYPTFMCNLHCQFCFIDDTSRKKFKSHVMSFQTFKKIVDEAAKEKIFYISLLGGEPLMVPWIEDAIEYVEKKRVRLEIVSNGTLITRSFAEKLKDTRYVGFNVSIHGTPFSHSLLTGSSNSMERIIKGLNILKEHGIRFGIGYTVTNINTSDNDLEYVLEIAKKYGVKYISLRRFQKTGRGASSLTDLQVPPDKVLQMAEKLRKWSKGAITTYALGAFAFLQYKTLIPKHPLNRVRIYYCGAGVRKLDILPNGEITPCILLWQLDPHKFSLGNIIESSIIDIWQNSRILENMRKRIIPKECKTCPYKEVCRGGCPALALSEYGSIEKPDPQCPLIQK
jgi:KxxxW cyclic peptide radical SAM maturase